MRTMRPIGIWDVALTVVLAALGVLLMVGNVNDPEIAASWWSVPLFLLVVAPILWRRAAPVPAAAAMLVALGLHVALFGEVVRCGVVLPLAFFLAFSAAARLELRGALAGLALVVASEAVMAQWDGVVSLAELVVFAPITAVLWGIGRVARSRARLASQLEARTSELRETRDRRARLEVEMERARLSSELDALLQRRLAELATLADEGARTESADAATAKLVDIEHRSRCTLDEMRAVVGGLRYSAPAEPLPTLTHLEALILRTKGTGAKLAVEGNPRALPPGVELSAYRIVEHLLDALGDTRDVAVRIRFGEDAIELAVSGPTRRRVGTTLAVERARERVQLHAGTLEAAVRGGRAEVVAQLPVLAPV